ncbi:MAG: porin [Gammaproteobacteria bacterium HGW-Gammaproteobacteria-3]|nr:MAG: porin [Gammaproteobacteria bacterium HGW-Gammaproteobacteria-3]
MNLKLKKNTQRQLALCSAVLFSSLVSADDRGVVESLTDFNVNETSLLKNLGFTVGGWVEGGIAGNPDDPDDGFNGPVTFNDRANEFNMHQLYGFIERAVDSEAGQWDLGFRADVLYGTDARFTTQANFDDKLIVDSESRLYKLAFPQVYAELFAPIGNGITTKIGHFYTIIGNEVVTAPDNFFFSHAYTMQYGEPFTHTGILASYPVNNNISVTGGVVTGWDSFFQQPANFLGGASYTTDDEKTSIAFSMITGDVGDNPIPDHNRTMYSIVINHDFTDKLHYTLQHDMGIEESYAGNSSAKWYGVNQYVTFDVNNEVSTGVRFEWFRDEDGVRVAPIGTGNTFPGGVPNHYFAVTAGLNYAPVSWLKLRPEVRYDWATEGKPFDDLSEDNQFLISADAIITF